MNESTVVLGVEDPALQESVLHFLDRLPGIRVVGAAEDGRELERSLRESAPDAAVVSPEVLGSATDLDGAAVLVVAERETTHALRTALRAGAGGFYLWPEDRETLARDAERAGRRRATETAAPGRVIAVYGPRGGAGVTFLATNLAAALASGGVGVALVDADPYYADVGAALGVVPGTETRTIEDLLPVADELSAEHLDRVLYTHPRGFRVLLGAQDPAIGRGIPPSLPAAAVRLLAASHDAVVVHLPRSLDDATLRVLELADDVLLVVTLDVLAFRDAKQALRFLAPRGVERRCRLVVNRAVRGEVIPDDVERVFGMRPIAVLRADRAVPRAQNRGELVAGRAGQTARRLEALARRVMEEGRS